MSEQLSYKDLERKIKYLAMYPGYLHHVIEGSKRNRFGTKSEGFENPFQALLPFRIDVTIKDRPIARN